MGSFEIFVGRCSQVYGIATAEWPSGVAFLSGRVLQAAPHRPRLRTSAPKARDAPGVCAATTEADATARQSIDPGNPTNRRPAQPGRTIAVPGGLRSEE